MVCFIEHSATRVYSSSDEANQEIVTALVEALEIYEFLCSVEANEIISTVKFWSSRRPAPSCSGTRNRRAVRTRREGRVGIGFALVAMPRARPVHFFEHKLSLANFPVSISLDCSDSRRQSYDLGNVVHEVGEFFDAKKLAWAGCP